MFEMVAVFSSPSSVKGMGPNHFSLHTSLDDHPAPVVSPLYSSESYKKSLCFFKVIFLEEVTQRWSVNRIRCWGHYQVLKRRCGGVGVRGGAQKREVEHAGHCKN